MLSFARCRFTPGFHRASVKPLSVNTRPFMNDSGGRSALAWLRLSSRHGAAPREMITAHHLRARRTDSTLLAARCSRPSPPCPGRAATRCFASLDTAATAKGRHLRGGRRRSRHNSAVRPAQSRRGSLSQPSHRLTGRHRTDRPVPNAGQALTYGYGFQRTGRTPRADLRIRRPRCQAGRCQAYAVESFVVQRSKDVLAHGQGLVDSNVDIDSGGRGPRPA